MPREKIRFLVDEKGRKQAVALPSGSTRSFWKTWRTWQLLRSVEVSLPNLLRWSSAGLTSTSEWIFRDEFYP
jgi:hypothetical protein